MASERTRDLEAHRHATMLLEIRQLKDMVSHLTEQMAQLMSRRPQEEQAERQLAVEVQFKFPLRTQEAVDFMEASLANEGLQHRLVVLNSIFKLLF